jgi:alpha(1,3/1,4) fucosyltransferase
MESSMGLTPEAPSIRPPFALYIDPPTHHFLQDRLFDSATNPTSGDNAQAPFVLVRDYFTRRGIPVHTADLMPAEPDDVRKMYVSMGRLPNYARLARRPDVTLSAFFAFECPIVEPSLYAALPTVQQHVRRVMCFSDVASLAPFTGAPIRAERFTWPQCLDGIHEAAWAQADRGFLTMINANKLPRVYHAELYTARLKAVEYFHRFGEIDVYGKAWDRAPMRVGKTWVPATFRRIHDVMWLARQRRWPDPVYAAVAAASRGTVTSKAATLGRYTFAICFENMVLPGWITEKIFDCFAAGCVPVYWGAPEVTDRIPAGSFIDMRQFEGFDDLRQFLHGLTPPQVAGYRDAARAFLESPAFDPFRPEEFLQHFRRFARDDLGVEV